jgi:hypothetical protein
MSDPATTVGGGRSRRWRATPEAGPAARLADWAPLLVAAPILVAVVMAVAHGWTPTGDQAGEVVRIGDVGTRRTPLLGPYSREGWSHPGPLLFWVCAPGWRAFGPAGVMATVGLVHATAAACVPPLARRVAGTALALATTAALLLMEVSIGAPGLVDVWNPYVGTIVLLAALLALMAVAGGTDGALPVAVGAASWAVQAHVGPALVVVAGGIVTAAALALRRRAPSARWVAVAVAVGALAWSAPVVEQLTSDPGNLRALATGLRAGGDRPPASTALEMTADHLGVVPAWARGTGGLANETGRTGTLLVPLVGLAVAAVVGRRRDDRGLVAAAAVSGAAFVAAVVSTTRIDLVLAAYLYRWTWAVGAVTWAVIATAGWRMISGTAVGRRLTPRLVPALAVLGAAATVAASVSMATAPHAVPIEGQSDAAAALADELADLLAPDGRYLATSRDGDDLGGVGLGVAVRLDAAGFDVAFIPLYAPQVGDDRVSTDATRQDLHIRAEAVPSARPPTPGATVVAVYDPLDAGDRARVLALSDVVREQVGAGPTDTIGAGGLGGTDLVLRGADPEAVAELADLQAQGSRYTVWLEPPPG